MRIGLVIENLVLRRTLEQFLSDLHHVIITARSILELGRFPGKSFGERNVIIAELYPGDRLGQDALHAIQICHPALPVILVARTTWNILETSIAIHCGVQAYLRLPLSLLELELLLIRLADRLERPPVWTAPVALSFSSGPSCTPRADVTHPVTIRTDRTETRFSTDRARGTAR